MWNRDGVVGIIASRLRRVRSLVKHVAHKATRGGARATVAFRETDDDRNVVDVFGVSLSARVVKRYVQVDIGGKRVRTPS